MCIDGSCGETTDPDDAEIEAMIRAMVLTGTKAMEAAMKAMTDVVDKEPDATRMSTLVGSLAMTRWKLDSAMRAMERVNPGIAKMVRKVEEGAHMFFNKDFDKMAEDSAKEFGLDMTGGKDNANS